MTKKWLLPLALLLLCSCFNKKKDLNNTNSPPKPCTPEMAGLTGTLTPLTKIQPNGSPSLQTYLSQPTEESLRLEDLLPKDSYKELANGILASWMKDEEEYKKNFSTEPPSPSGIDFTKNRLLLLYLKEPGINVNREVRFIVDDGKKITIGVQDSGYCSGAARAPQLRTETYLIPTQARVIEAYMCPAQGAGNCGALP